MPSDFVVFINYFDVIIERDLCQHLFRIQNFTQFHFMWKFELNLHFTQNTNGRTVFQNEKKKLQKTYGSVSLRPIIPRTLKMVKLNDEHYFRKFRLIK